MSDSGPGGKYKALTKSDGTSYVGLRALFIGTAGDVVLDDGLGNVSVTFKNVANGTLLPVCAKRVMTATTAADIVGIFNNDGVSG